MGYFRIFDYEKIPVIEYEKVDGNSGVSFSVKNGEVKVGYQLNPREGGGMTYTIEYLWKHPEKCVPAEFQSKISDILKKINTAIVRK